MNPSQQERLRKLWTEGVKAAAIAAELGVSDTTVRGWRRKLGLSPRKPGNASVPWQARKREIPLLSRDMLARAVALWEQGHDTSDISIKLNRHECAVANSLSRWRERTRLSLICRMRGACR